VLPGNWIIHLNNSHIVRKELRSGAYLDVMGGSFAELPETEEAVGRIKTILKAPASSRPLQLRQNASRSKVLSLNQAGKLSEYRYVIFSCHGILPGEIDQISQPAIVLSNPDPTTGSNGFLTMADVFSLKLNAQLVTLSACNTGRGKIEKGQGVRGLTRAFMYAGTPAISVTLWSVESQSAMHLSAGLYSHLSKGKNKAEALRQIKLKMINGQTGELYRHPFFWAPVVIFGDGRS
jgi:CHAT domain-containing protein